MESIKTQISAIKVGLSVASLSASICGNKEIVDLTNTTLNSIDNIDTNNEDSSILLDILIKQYGLQLQIIAVQPMPNYEIGGILMNKNRQNGIIDNSGKIQNNENN